MRNLIILTAVVFGLLFSSISATTMYNYNRNIDVNEKLDNLTLDIPIDAKIKEW